MSSNAQKLCRGVAVLLAGVCLGATAGQAADATWAAPSPGPADWNDPTNWSPSAPPKGPTGTAFFGGPGVADAVVFSKALTSVATIQFNAGAQQYTFNVCSCQELRITGQGVVNLSGLTQEFVNDGTISFRNASTAGNATFTNFGAGLIEFRHAASAGNAVINNSDFAIVSFLNNSSAGNATINLTDNAVVQFSALSKGGTATINNSGLGVVAFMDRTTLEDGHIVNSDSAFTLFTNQSTAGSAAASITNNDGSLLIFADRSSAGAATITLNDFAAAEFVNRSSAGSATIVNNSAFGLAFFNQSTAENATITTKGGSFTLFFDRSNGGQAQFITEAGGIVDFSGTDGPNNDHKITAGSFAGAGDYFLGHNELTIGGNNLSTEVSGTINDGGCSCSTGPASLVKVGTGTLTLSGINTYTGPTTVNDGALIVNGSIETSSLLTVNAGATVGGNGNLPTTIVNGGTLSPGNSVGQLNVIGNLQFDAGSLYQVEMFGTTADKTRVTGAATLLGGTVQVAILGPMQFGTPYTIVSTGGGVTGQFAGLSGGTNYVDMALSYPGQDVLLTLTPALGSFPGLNVNQRSTATGLDHGLLQAGTSAGFDALFQLPPALLPNALTQLSGELGTAAAPAGLESMNRFLMLMLDPFAGTRGDNGTVGPALGFAPAPVSRDAAKAYAAFLPITKAPPLAFEERWTGWGAAYGSYSSADGDALIGSHDRTVRTGHIAAGFDRRLSPNTVVGLALSGGSANFQLAGGLGSGRGDILQGGIYGATRFDSYYLAASLAASFYDVSADRIVTLPISSTLAAAYQAHGFGARIEGGRRFVLAGAGVTPFVALQVRTIRTDAYGEQAAIGGAGIALNYAAQTTSRLRTEIGVAVDRRIGEVWGGSFNLFARIAWAHEYWRDNSIVAAFQTLPGSGFTVEGAAPAGNAALLAAGAELKFANGLSLRGKLEGEFAGSVTSYAASATLRKTW